MIKSFYIPLFMACLFLVFSCKKQPKEGEDHSGHPLPLKPEIEIVSLQPKEGTEIVCGAEDKRTIRLASLQLFKLSFNLKAKEGLSQYKIDIHHNFDCHGHGRMSMDAYEPWKVLKIVDVTGQQKMINEELQVPSNVLAGNYHFMLQCVDEKGNEAPLILYSIIVSNSKDTEIPQIKIDNPKTDAINLQKTQPFDLTANITDNDSLATGRVELSYFDSANEEFTVDQFLFPSNTAQSYAYKYVYTFPNYLTLGIYNFVLKVYDKVGNLNEKQIKVNVIP